MKRYRVRRIGFPDGSALWVVERRWLLVLWDGPIDSASTREDAVRIMRRLEDEDARDAWRTF